MTGSVGIRLVLDQGVPRDAAARLRELGYECTHVSEVGMWKADDAEILKWSSERNAIIVTLDADFHTILAVSEASGPSVIRLRLQGLGASEVVDMIRKVLQSFESRSEARMSGTVKTRKTTCHWLPIGSSD